MSLQQTNGVRVLTVSSVVRGNVPTNRIGEGKTSGAYLWLQEPRAGEVAFGQVNPGDSTTKYLSVVRTFTDVEKFRGLLQRGVICLAVHTWCASPRGM